MVSEFSRPVLSPEERAALLATEQPLRAVKSVLADLQEIGFDVSVDLEWADNQERMRKGLLDRFSAQRPVRRAPRGQ